MEEAKGIIEAILFAVGKEVNIKDLALTLEKSKQEIEKRIEELK